jgi:predicted RNA-binding Zn ribbon-like protein
LRAVSHPAIIENVWDKLGYELALDLTYSIRDHRGTTVDLMADPAALREFLDTEGDRLPSISDDAVKREFPAWLELREAIRASFAASVAGERLPEDALAEINRRAAAEPVAPRVAPDGSTDLAPIAPVDPTTAALAAIARSAVDILGSEQRDRVHFCAAHGCGMYYLASRPQQRWCSSQCGTRERVARHAARAKAR